MSISSCYFVLITILLCVGSDSFTTDVELGSCTVIDLTPTLNIYTVSTTHAYDIVSARLILPDAVLWDLPRLWLAYEHPTIDVLNGKLSRGGTVHHNAQPGRYYVVTWAPQPTPAILVVTGYNTVGTGASVLPCSTHGSCDFDWRGGALTSTCICDGNYVGSNCEFVCPTYDDWVCNGHGYCDVNSNPPRPDRAVCWCYTNYTGDACEIQLR